MKYMKNKIFDPECGVIKTDTFSSIYPILNSYILKSKEWEDSRDGKVKELLDFKTIITNPYRRCVGGCRRDINIFFLLAEAMWIALGRKDVEFLSYFNKKMVDFSDDGKVFHAPYGWRLRHYNVRSENLFINEGLNASKGYDQVIDAIKIFSENPNSRQVVMSIWNPEFDLGTKTKDIPCNDLIMLKIRKGKLITTIQNRSNDLHWGLPTNIFQFSFLTELIASSLGIELGTQTHNSQSLHIYSWNKIAENMSKCYDNIRSDNSEGDIANIYDISGVKEKHIDFHFNHDVPANRFREIEYYLSIIVKNLIMFEKDGCYTYPEIDELRSFSSYLFHIFRLLIIYLDYKKNIENIVNKDDIQFYRMKAINAICTLEDSCNLKNWDIILLAKNFFASKLNTDIGVKYIGKL